MRLHLSEFIGPREYERAPLEHVFNLQSLYHKVSILRYLSNIPFEMRTEKHPSRGYRSLDAHLALYERLKKKAPMGSMHLFGAAVDIADRDMRLKTWISENLEVLERLDLYMEHFEATPTWVHIQLYAPASGNRFFYP